jgi:hypothetical protein
MGLDQWNRIKSPELNLLMYGSMNFDEDTKGRKDSLFNKWCWENKAFTWKIMKLDPDTM